MKPKIDTIVQFSGLESGRYEYNYTLDNSFFERFKNEELREGEVNFAVVLEKRERLLMFNFAFHGVVKTICDRCLGELEVPVSGEETLCVKFSDTETSDKEDVRPGDVAIHFGGARTLGGGRGARDGRGRDGSTVGCTQNIDGKINK